MNDKPDEATGGIDVDAVMNRIRSTATGAVSPSLGENDIKPAAEPVARGSYQHQTGAAQIAPQAMGDPTGEFQILQQQLNALEAKFSLLSSRCDLLSLPSDDNSQMNALRAELAAVSSRVESLRADVSKKIASLEESATLKVARAIEGSEKLAAKLDQINREQIDLKAALHAFAKQIPEIRESANSATGLMQAALVEIMARFQALESRLDISNETSADLPTDEPRLGNS
jgi:chromosome segregation ATPase